MRENDTNEMRTGRQNREALKREMGVDMGVLEFVRYSESDPERNFSRHTWSDTERNGRAGTETVLFVKTEVENLGEEASQEAKIETFHQAMAEIRGLNGNQIRAVRSGLDRNNMQDHDWTNTERNSNAGEATARYIEGKPDGVDAQQVMDNIRGLNGNQIEEVIGHMDNGRTNLLLSDEELYRERFDREQYDRVAEQIKEAKKEGAVSGMFSPGVEDIDIPQDVAKNIARYLDDADIVNVSSTKQSARDGNQASHAEKIENMRRNNQPQQRTP